MASGSSGSGWLLKGLGCLGVLAVLCCCGGLVGLRFFPEMLMSFFLEDAPLSVPPTPPQPVRAALERAAACLALTTTGEAKLDPDAVGRMLIGEGDPDVAALFVGASSDQGHLELSLATDDQPPRYFNLQVSAAFTISNGWFTDLRTSRLFVGGHDATPWLSGQQLAAQANQSLANKRAEDPEMGAFMDGIESAKVDLGQLVLRLRPGSPAMEKLCAAP